MSNITLGMDFSNGESKTIIAVVYGGRGFGKTFLMKLWQSAHCPDLLSKQLIRRLASEAIINISITS